MHNTRFFDQILVMLEAGEAAAASAMMVGYLHNAIGDEQNWHKTRGALRSHPVYTVFLEDPYTRRSAIKPRGYAGDAELIDLVYDRRYPHSVSAIGDALFRYSTNFSTSQAVRLRKDHAITMVTQASEAGSKVLSLACGHFREGDGLKGKDLSRFTLVDQDPLSIARVRSVHGASPQLHEANVFRFLKEAASTGQTFDLIYTLGLTDYLDYRTMQLFYKLMKACLAPGGTILLANFLPHHLATGWMDALMDWQLIYRDEDELSALARESGMEPQCWRDPTDTIVWCRMT